jgi:predicted  nucleic acid-binding Zn-ribbon protein
VDKLQKESFRILKELNSLTQKLPQLELAISQELNRLEKIENMRLERQEKLTLYKEQSQQAQAELDTLEKAIQTLSNQIKKDKDHLKSSSSQEQIIALETQIQSMQTLLETQENAGLDLLEKVETLDKAIEDAEHFLQGSQETLKEIEQEILQNNKEVYLELQQKRSRIKSLEKELPEKLVHKLFILKKQKKDAQPLTQISVKNTCQLCGYLLPKALADSIEIKLKLHCCPGCERIIIPESVKFN